MLAAAIANVGVAEGDMSELGWLSCGPLGSALQILAGQLAYIDPATGSMLFQMLVAGFLGALMAFRRFRDRLLGKLSALFGRGRAAEPGRASEAPPAESASDASAERP